MGKEKERANLEFCYKVELGNVRVAGGGCTVKDICFSFFLSFKIEIL